MGEISYLYSLQSRHFSCLSTVFSLNTNDKISLVTVNNLVVLLKLKQGALNFPKDHQSTILKNMC